MRQGKGGEGKQFSTLSVGGDVLGRKDIAESKLSLRYAENSITTVMHAPSQMMKEHLHYCLDQPCMHVV